MVKIGIIKNGSVKFGVIKAFLLVLLGTQILFADGELHSKILNIVGESSYNRNKSFIKKIFSNEAEFYKRGNLDIYKVLLALKENGLLNLKFSRPQEFNAIFISQTSPVFLLKAINRSLSHMGYSYFVTSEASHQDYVSKIKISLPTEHIIDPTTLLNSLAKSGFVGVDIRCNSPLEWEYELVLNDSKIPDSTFLSRGNNLRVSEVSGEYWFEVSDSRGRIEVSLLNRKKFNPKIVFFDKNLNVLEVEILGERAKFNSDVVANTKFVQITDSISPNNIKGGINIIFK